MKQLTILLLAVIDFCNVCLAQSQYEGKLNGMDIIVRLNNGAKKGNNVALSGYYYFVFPDGGYSSKENLSGSWNTATKKYKIASYFNGEEYNKFSGTFTATGMTGTYQGEEGTHRISLVRTMSGGKKLNTSRTKKRPSIWSREYSKDQFGDIDRNCPYISAIDIAHTNLCITIGKCCGIVLFANSIHTYRDAKQVQIKTANGNVVNIPFEQDEARLVITDEQAQRQFVNILAQGNFTLSVIVGGVWDDNKDYSMWSKIGTETTDIREALRFLNGY
jgi:hypothetical protein